MNAYIFHRTDLMIDVSLPPEQSFRLQLLVALSCTVCTPLGLLVNKKEHLLLLALLLAALALLLLVNLHNSIGLYVSSILMGGAFGVTNAYATVVWEYFFGRADAERIKQTSIAITSATSGSAVWVFAMSRQLMESYHPAMNAYAALALLLAVLDLMALAKPEFLEAIVRHAPTWEQATSHPRTFVARTPRRLLIYHRRLVLFQLLVDDGETTTRWLLLLLGDPASQAGAS